MTKCDKCNEHIFAKNGEPVEKAPAKITYTDENHLEEPEEMELEVCLDCYSEIYRFLEKTKKSSKEGDV